MVSDNSSRSNAGGATPRASAWLAALGLVLLLGELGVLGLSLFHPRVDAYYRSYYIAGDRNCWLQDRQAKAATAALRTIEIKIATLSPPEACFLLDGGWSGQEKWGVWSNGRVASLDLPVVAGSHRLEITLTAFSPHNRQSVTIRLNGAFAGRYFVTSRNVSTLQVAVPPGAAGNLKLSFWIRHPASPSFFAVGNDQRQLGIGLIALRWK